MKDQPNPSFSEEKSAVHQTALRQRFERCRAELATLDWLTEGSVTEGHPGHWRWTRKVRAKTVTVTLSPDQATAFRAAIAQHRRLEKLILELRTLSQSYLLECLPNPPRRRPKSSSQTVAN